MYLFTHSQCTCMILDKFIPVTHFDIKGSAYHCYALAVAIIDNIPRPCKTYESILMLQEQSPRQLSELSAILPWCSALSWWYSNKCNTYLPAGIQWNGIVFSFLGEKHYHECFPIIHCFLDFFLLIRFLWIGRLEADIAQVPGGMSLVLSSNVLKDCIFSITITIHFVSQMIYGSISTRLSCLWSLTSIDRHKGRHNRLSS